MLKEAGKFYKNYKGSKTIYTTYMKRIYKGLSFEEAIIKASYKHIKNKITPEGRICTICKTYKVIGEFGKDKYSKFGHKIKCKECCRKIASEFYNKNKDEILEKKKKYNSSEQGKIKTKLNKIFYSDPNIQKIIKLDGINKRKKLSLKGEIQKDKYFYFLNRGYDKELLSKIYT